VSASSGRGRCNAFASSHGAHPDVALLVGGQDHRQRLRIDRRDDGIRLGRQEAVDEVRAGHRLGLGAPVALELGPDASEREQRPVLVEGEPDDILLLRLRGRLGRVGSTIAFGDVVGTL
jgi:hypothetical protein